MDDIDDAEIKRRGDPRWQRDRIEEAERGDAAHDALVADNIKAWATVRDLRASVDAAEARAAAAESERGALCKKLIAVGMAAGMTLRDARDSADGDALAIARAIEGIQRASRVDEREACAEIADATRAEREERLRALTAEGISEHDPARLCLTVAIMDAERLAAAIRARGKDGAS